MCQSRGGLDKMVTIIPSYVYSIFAALIVGTIIVSSCSFSMVNLRGVADNRQLVNIDEYVAAQSLILVTHVTQEGQNVTQFLTLPTQIGNHEYSIAIANDSSSAWVESGFGSIVKNQPEISIPANVAASGTYISGWGRAVLQCYRQNQTITLILTSE